MPNLLVGEHDGVRLHAAKEDAKKLAVFSARRCGRRQRRSEAAERGRSARRPRRRPGARVASHELGAAAYAIKAAARCFDRLQGPFVSSPPLAREALVALRVPFEPLRVTKGHDPPSQESFDLGPGPGFDVIDPSYPD